MYAVAIIIGLAVCLATYYSIHHKQIVPVLASAAATMAALLIGKILPNTWQIDCSGLIQQDTFLREY